jgi:hypothetical protein
MTIPEMILAAMRDGRERTQNDIVTRIGNSDVTLPRLTKPISALVAEGLLTRTYLAADAVLFRATLDGIAQAPPTPQRRVEAPQSAKSVTKLVPPTSEAEYGARWAALALSEGHWAKMPGDINHHLRQEAAE